MPKHVGPVEPGDRNRRVIIQQLTETIGGSGMPVETWSTLLTVFMSKDGLKGNERFAADQLSAPFDTRWVMGYVASMDPELVDVPKTRRLSYQGRIYDIVSAQLIGQCEAVELETLAASGI